MADTLYRKYRPQSFADVVGQEHVTTTLQHQVVSSKLAHAYLFCGMRGVGKTTVARLLAKALNCRKRATDSAEPCNGCESCRAITAGLSLDVLEIDAASNRRIDDVRELREHIPYGPSGTGYKVVIIDEVHMLTTEAFNALLKTLEEPPSHVVFVLATTEVHKLPDTIISRCQRFDFRRLTVRAIVDRLGRLATAEQVSVEPEVLRQVAYLAEGSTRDAESYLGKLLSLGEPNITVTHAGLVLPHSDRQLALTFVKHLIKYQPAEAVTLINRFLFEGGEVAYFYRQVLELMRELLMVKLGRGVNPSYEAELEPELAAELTALVTEITQARLQAMLERWLAVADSWRSAEVPQLPLELAAVALTARPEAAPLLGRPRDGELGTASIQETRGSGVQPPPGNFSLANLSERWPEIVTKLRNYNHSLSFILSIAKPLTLEGNTLTIAFQYQLHYERLQDPHVIKAVVDAVREVTGVPLKVRGVVQELEASGGDLLSSVLTTFGGQVVG